MIKCKYERVRGGVMIKKRAIILSFCILIIINIVTSLYNYNKRMRFENYVNQKFYYRFNSIFEGGQTSGIQSNFKILKKAIYNKTIDMADFEEVSVLNWEDKNFIGEISYFYEKFYNKKKIINPYRLKQVIFSTDLRRGTERTTDSKYKIKDFLLNQFKDYYILEKIDVINDVIDKFNVKNHDYLTSKNEKNKNTFVKDGYWIDLFNEIETSLIRLEKEYDFGDKAPKNLEVRSVDLMSYPDKIIKEINFASERGYKIVDTEYGVFFNISSGGMSEKLDIVSINKNGNNVDIVIDEGDDIKIGNLTGNIHIYGLIRGLKPGSVQSLKFNVKTTTGGEFKGIKKIYYKKQEHLLNATFS